MPWEDLEGEIAEVFGDFSYRTDEIDDAAARLLARERSKGAEYQRSYYARNRKAEMARTAAREKRRLTEDEEYRERRNQTKRESKRRVREMTKILKAENAQHANRLYHVDDGDGRPRCGVSAAGMFILDPEKLNRATCAACLSDVDLRMHPGAAVLDGLGPEAKKIYEALPDAEQLRARLVEAARAYGVAVKRDVSIATTPPMKNGGRVRGKWPA